MKRYAHLPRVRRGGEAWQLIYMDLMTIVMVFFVILWSLNQKKESGVSSTIGEESVKMVNLPGDVLFSSGKSKLTREGRGVLGQLFDDETGAVLNFDTSALVKRLLVIHGHTDGDGEKQDNLDLGFERARAAYDEIKRYNGELAEHVVICTHADNSPAQEVPIFQGRVTAVEAATIRDAKSKNRRITIEDKVVNRMRNGYEKP